MLGIAGWLSAVSIPALIVFAMAAQAVAVGVLIRLDGFCERTPLIRRKRRSSAPPAAVCT